MSKKLLYVHVTGTGMDMRFQCLSHELRGLPAGTYHIFEMENGSCVYLNDFGVRSVVTAPTMDALEY